MSFAECHGSVRANRCPQQCRRESGIGIECTVAHRPRAFARTGYSRRAGRQLVLQYTQRSCRGPSRKRHRTSRECTGVAYCA